MHTTILRPSLRFVITRLLLCLLALAALAPAAAGQSVSPTFTLNGDLQSLTDSWASWGRDPVNSRFNPFATRIRRSNVHRLELKWAFAFPDGVTSASSQPAVVGDTLYVGGWNAKVYALDRETGATRWTYDTAAFTGSVEGGGTQLPIGFNAVRDAPAVSEGKVYFGAGQGGSINGAGAVVVGDEVYVNSGYSAFGPGTSLAGNVLLKFSLRDN